MYEPPVLGSPDGQIVTLALVKSYLKIEHTAEDVVLSTLIIPAAEAYAVWYTRRPIQVLALLPTVKQAVCLSCGDQFLNREARSQGKPYEGNPTVDAMLWAVRDLCSYACEEEVYINPLLPPPLVRSYE